MSCLNDIKIPMSKAIFYDNNYNPVLVLLQPIIKELTATYDTEYVFDNCGNKIMSFNTGAKNHEFVIGSIDWCTGEEATIASILPAPNDTIANPNKKSVQNFLDEKLVKKEKHKIETYELSLTEYEILQAQQRINDKIIYTIKNGKGVYIDNE